MPKLRQIFTHQNRLQAVFVITCAVLCLILLGLFAFTTRSDERGKIIDIISPLMGLIGIMGLSYGAWRTFAQSRRLGLCWLFIALAMTFNFLADLVYGYIELALEVVPIPSIADILYWLFYPTLLVGVLLLPVQPRTSLSRIKIWIEILIVHSSVGVYLWSFLLGSYIAHIGDEDLFTLAFNIMYVILGSLLVLALLVLLFNHRERLRVPVYLFLFWAIAVTFAGDIIYDIETLQDAYVTGSFADLGWMISYLLFGLAGIFQVSSLSASDSLSALPAPTSLRRTSPGIELYLPPITVFAAFFLLVAYNYIDIHISFTSLIFWLGILILLSISLQHIDARENLLLSFKLSSLNVALERHVQERTSELAGANGSLALANESLAQANESLAQANQTLKEEITARTQTAEALQVSEALYRGVVEDFPGYILRFRPDGTINYVNAAYCQFLQRPSSELINRSIFDTIPIYNLDQQKDNFLSLTIDQPVKRVDIHTQSLDGSLVWQRWIDRAIFKDNQIIEYQSIGEDITDRKHAEEQLYFNAYHDSLTGLPNRAFLMTHLEKLINTARDDPDYHYALLYMDIDNFKLVNDSLGHAIGDHLLIAASGRLKSCLRAQDIIARLGGDEFIILLDDVTRIEEAVLVGSRVLQEIKKPFGIEGHTIVVSSSIGIVFNQFQDEAQGNLRDADIALYHAKAKGKDTYTIFESNQRMDPIGRLELETHLRRGIEKGEFFMHYQPIYSMQEGTLHGFEALLRWGHPEKGVITPEGFIHVAEETGMIIPLGDWILQESCRQISVWQHKYPQEPPLMISVNISPRQLVHRDFIDRLQAILQETGIPPSSLALELTESSIAENMEQTLAILTRVDQMQVQIHIDDFGTGYSTFGRLINFPIHTIKIDRSYIDKIAENSNGQGIVRAMIAMGSELGLETIAEGIEKNYQYEQLKMLGCNLGQGYLLSTSMPSAEAERLLAKIHKSLQV